jgi:hypothetical protein
MTRVSILLPFHVDDVLLHEAIHSTMLAMDKDDELVLINTSNSKFSNCYRQDNVSVIDAPNCKYIPALSLGISLVKGKFIALMNSDDLVATNRFDKQVEHLDSNQTDLAFSGIRKFSGGNRRIFPILGDFCGDHYWPGMLLLGSYGANASWLFRRTWAKDRELFSSKGDASDWTTALRVLPETKISYLPEKLYFYRMHKNQITRTNPEKHPTLLETWSRLNKQLNLPELSQHEISVLTLPKFAKVEKRLLENIVDWSIEFRKLIPVNSGSEQLLRRRLAILKSRHPFEFDANCDLPILARMLSEFTWNFSKPRV